MRRPLTSAIMLFAVLAPAHGAGDQIETKAGTWKTWVISSGREFRVAAPPNEAATAAEIGDLKSLASKRDAAAKEIPVRGSGEIPRAYSASKQTDLNLRAQPAWRNRCTLDKILHGHGPGEG